MFLCKIKGCNQQIEEDLLEHIGKHIEKNKNVEKCLWEGCKCTQKFSSSYALAQHIKCHFQTPNLECAFCHVLFAKEDSLKKHEEKHMHENEKKSRQADRLFFVSEVRDEETENLHLLLEERFYHVSLNRLLKKELVRNKENDDSYNDYLG
ncbi:hypothetical protein EHP00_920 [Ecytonucleospora hepatopenaei]|uniref:C2H2-type domain-containing protein n=1 Tax=Ecytonucleospora hepatopenaei TaxID=646526 RepID=A0A1W0E4V4_9MICR|nr:hypothetical protein EHP00_920 [Ecytonucleospora hepatopenaei]